jgi:hypothetical protein
MSMSSLPRLPEPFFDCEIALVTAFAARAARAICLAVADGWPALRAADFAVDFFLALDIDASVGWMGLPASSR